MMTPLVALIVAATALNGILGGFSFEIALVKLPTRRRIGAVAYATFARGSDLGNGIWVYPTTAIGATLLTFAATIVAYIESQPTAALLPLSLAALTSIGHFVATSRAAPLMVRVGKMPPDETRLSALLDGFARWHTIRAALQLLTFLALLWALVAMR